MSREPHQAYTIHDEYNNMQSLHEPILNGDDKGRWYPRQNSRLRVLFIFYIVSCILNFGYFVVYQAAKYPHKVHFWDGKVVEHGWKFIYFWQWYGCAQCVFYLFALVDLSLRLRPVSAYLHPIKDILYNFVFSITVLEFFIYAIYEISPHYGSLNNVNLTIIYEDVACNIMPMVLLFLETFFIVHRSPALLSHFIRDSLLGVGFFGAYSAYAYCMKSKNGRFAYKLLNTYPDSSIVAWHVCCALSTVFFFYICRSIARNMWSEKPLTTEHLDDNFGSFASFVENQHGGVNHGTGGFAEKQQTISKPGKKGSSRAKANEVRLH